MARALRSVVLLAATGLTIAGCSLTGSSHPPSDTTTTVTESACANRGATSSVLASLGAADGRPGATTVPRSLFYGTCGKAEYAVATFAPSHAATAAESVAFQDHGAYPEYFQRALPAR